MARQAVVVLHGMGEQIPMQTLDTLVEAVWTTDDSLVSRHRPDPRTGGKRAANASWVRPDSRTNSAELYRIATESDRNGDTTDFYEFYWAHLMTGTTWEHVRAWVADLLWRRPGRVPRPARPVWGALWFAVLGLAAAALYAMVPKPGDPPVWQALAGGIGGALVALFASNVLVKRFGDVARYVTARPANVGRRQEIRNRGVAFLDRLISSGDYDRIVVVAHSLGAIVAYDILSLLFDRYNTTLAGDAPATQPARHALEEMVRRAAGLPRADGTVAAPEPLDIDAFQAAQSAARVEAVAQGCPWIVSDFVTLGAPLVHAGLLLARGRADLRARQARRLLPTCPPAMEYDGVTKLRHFTYDPEQRRGRAPMERRVPHHAALFAYTRWTNIHSDARSLVTGDVVSGPAGTAFGLEIDGRLVTGIRDVPVLPAMDGAKVARGHRRRLFTHRRYWDPAAATERVRPRVPHHIAALRRALGLLRTD